MHGQQFDRFARSVPKLLTALGRWLGGLQARVVLTLCYFLVIPPFAGLVRWIADPLEFRRTTARGWHQRPDPRGTVLERARRQY